MQLKMPLSPKATIDRALARVVAAQGLWAAAGETGLARTPAAAAKARMVSFLCGRKEVSVVRGRDGPRIAPVSVRAMASSKWKRVSSSATWLLRSRTLVHRPSLPACGAPAVCGAASPCYALVSLCVAISGPRP